MLLIPLDFIICRFFGTEKNHICKKGTNIAFFQGVF